MTFNVLITIRVRSLEIFPILLSKKTTKREGGGQKSDADFETT